MRKVSLTRGIGVPPPNPKIPGLPSAGSQTNDHRGPRARTRGGQGRGGTGGRSAEFPTKMWNPEASHGSPGGAIMF
jgi:hypothetical protein